MNFSNHISSLKPSATLALNDKVNRMIAQGQDIINLTVGELNYYEPEIARERAKEAIDKHFTHYTDSDGIYDLRQAISEKLRNENFLNYKPEQITVSAGGKQALFNCFFTLIDHGDEVIVPTPCWSTYLTQIKLCGGIPATISTDEKTNFKITPVMLENAITPRTKLLLLNSPSNPTGAAYSENELKELSGIIRKHKLLVISYEIYERLVYVSHYVSVGTVSEYLQENTITINGFSKSFGMTGWRIGYSASPIAIAEKISSLQSQVTANISSISQIAALAAINHFNPENKVNLQENRDYLYKFINERSPLSVPNLPEGAFYLFPNISAVVGKSFKGKMIKNSSELCSLLLENAQIAVTAGDAFVAPNNIRISYAKSMNEIVRAAQKMARFFAQLS
ncbi:pyridoxal phosphate-dependent aminotransferase [Sporolactobacillus inulinus]|uniref:Aminotransferase n=1 Tax=Sporolactobacillus inulinus CASD TaxID=1069536 RepID=A0A0U1QP01_9BACL|nr:pyridoxal phosphate-dependent aminotransferase [Sporolactobacillus inulinus]KLI02533.1 aspartate aminotransferase [Sporolactobacillus inulinus CASD]GEB77712.1 aminotransferase [Sporolactobacillus inulinus]